MLYHKTTTYGSLEHDTRSHQKKARLTKTKGTLPLKWLAALCVLECVGAKGVSPGSLQIAGGYHMIESGSCGDGGSEGGAEGAAAGPDTPSAPTHSITQRATSHLSRRVPFILVSVAFFWCERVSASSEP